MVRMYDELFFGGKILPAAEAEGLSFGLSSRMTKVAGKLVTEVSRRNPSRPAHVRVGALIHVVVSDV